MRTFGSCILFAAILSGITIPTTGAAAGPVVDFQSLANSGTGWTSIGPVHLEDGFRVENISSTSLHAFQTPHTGNVNNYAGSTGIYNAQYKGTTELTKVGGGSFHFASISLSQLGKDTPSASSLSFVGTYAAGGTITKGVVVPFGAFGFVPHAFGGAWTGLSRVTWTWNGNTPQFDDIVLDSPVVPLPSGAAMAMVGMGVIGVRRRRN